jgi:hypothetical protein
MNPIVLFAALLAAAPSDDRQCVLLVVGAAGEPAYGAQFQRWADRWEQAANRADVRLVRIGDENSDGASDRDCLQAALARETRESTEPLWLVFIGHGTFDGRRAKFNMRGLDVTAEEVADWLTPCQRPLAVINCASSSGPFINGLSGQGRVIVTATKSGDEHNYARFGEYFSAAILDQSSDLDKDRQTSLLEAFLAASGKVAEFYAEESRLASEHALLDDNGDGLGTPASWFRGVRAVRKAKDGTTVDGSRAHQFHLIRTERERSIPAAVRARRDELELAVIRLRDAKESLGQEEYYAQLEPLLLELARLYEKLDDGGDAL